MNLNKIMNQYHINSINNSCSVMKLVKDHNPTNSGELYNLFQKESKKKFELLVDELVEACKKEGFETDRFTVNAYLYDLFFVKTLKGAIEESKILIKLKNIGLNMRNAYLKEEKEFAIDLVGDQIAIQVKPMSYLNISNSEHKKQLVTNFEKNKKFKGEVFYYFY